MWQHSLNALDTAKHSANFIASKQQTAEFYFERVMPRAYSLLAVLKAPVQVVNDMSVELF
jgi:hypothetical protein